MTKVTKKKNGPGSQKRKRYTMDLKFLVCQWKIRDSMRPIDIINKLKEQYNVVVSPGTLAGWYSPMMVKKFQEIAPDRLKVTDLGHNPKQRPDILVDRELIKEIENMSIKCLELCNSLSIPVVDDDPVPSTSGVNTRAASNTVNTSTSLDEQDFGTQNKDYLESEIHVEVIKSSSMSSDTLPDLKILTFKNESSDNEQGVTVFRAINQERKI